MKEYLVQISNRALTDMEDIYYYIANILQAPDTAQRQYDRIADAIKKLDVFPERYKVMDSEPERSMGFRRIQVDSYTVFFVVKEDRVYVIRVLYSGSDIGNRLKENG